MVSKETWGRCEVPTDHGSKRHGRDHIGFRDLMNAAGAVEHLVRSQLGGEDDPAGHAQHAGAVAIVLVEHFAHDLLHEVLEGRELVAATYRDTLAELAAGNGAGGIG